MTDLDNKFIIIDGKFREGGGQILRNAISFSCILRRPVRIINIRANRPNPGLSTQHLYGLNLLAQVTGAQVTGNYIKSTQVEICPGMIKSGKYFMDTQTAASISLILQCALPVLIFGNGPSQLDLIGGTNVGMAPQVDFMTEVLRPNLEHFGVSFDFDLIKRGYYPRGGGQCRVTIPPVKHINSVQLISFGHLNEINGWCFVAGRLPIRLANDMKYAAENQLKKLPYNQCNIEAYKETPEVSRDNGSGLILCANTSENCVLGTSVCGDKEVKASEMGTKAGKELLNLLTNETCVDQYVQDQLIIYMALAKGFSQIKTLALTNHTLTAIYVAEQMAGVKFKIDEQANEHVLLSCTGIGHTNEYNI